MRPALVHRPSAIDRPVAARLGSDKGKLQVRDRTRIGCSRRLRLEPGSLTELQLPDASLDGAITINTVYFLDGVAPALREFARVRRPGGRVVIGVGDPDAMAKMPFTEHGFHLRPIAELMNQAGPWFSRPDPVVRFPTAARNFSEETYLMFRPRPRWVTRPASSSRRKSALAVAGEISASSP